MIESAPETPTAFKVYAQNWPALTLWADLWSRWRFVVGLGGAMRQGLDFTQMQPAFALCGIAPDRWAGLYRDLLTMEKEALDALRATDGR